MSLWPSLGKGHRGVGGLAFLAGPCDSIRKRVNGASVRPTLRPLLAALAAKKTRDRAEGEDREEDEREEADGRGLNGRKARAERAGEEGVHSAILVGVNICCSACQGSIYRDGLTPGPLAEY